MALTVQELTELSGLRTRFLAGRSGGSRTVLWAHSTDQRNPWEWLGTGDLLLTTGHVLPRNPAEQVRFLTELNRSNLAGIALGEDPEAPRISDEVLRTADELSFPFLLTEHSVPWTSVIRIVADSNAQKGHAAITKVVRAYDVMRRSYASSQTPEGLLERLGTECGHLLQVVDRGTGRSLFDIDKAVPQQVVDYLTGTSAALPALSRISADSGTVFVLPVAESPRSVMIATPLGHLAEVDLMVLQHISTIVGIEVERRAAEQLYNRTSGARLLRNLLAGPDDPEAVRVQLESFGLGEPPWCVLVWPQNSEPSSEVMNEVLAREQIPVLVTFEPGENLAFFSAARIDDVCEALSGCGETRFGASMPFSRLNRVGDAVREARWAQEGTRGSDTRISVYGRDTSPFLPRSIAEAEAVVDQILGAVIEYDRRNSSQLMRSLNAYFEANRSWKDAADSLHIHRQTLIYRISKIERLSGRRIQDLAQQTELYLALQAWQILNGRSTPFR